jgi:hypothetical protein
VRVPGKIDDPDTLVPRELTVVTPAQFDRAMEEYGQFGPTASIPIEQRWPAVIPDVDRSRYVALKTQCDEVRWTTADWAEDIRCRPVGEDALVVLQRMIAVKYPFLTPRRRSEVASFAWFVTR